MNYDLLRDTVGVLATVGLYTVLYRENKFYRFFEHVFLGLAVGYTILALWQDTLKDTWYDKMVGKVPTGVPTDPNYVPGSAGHWAYIMLLPFGLMAYFVFSKKHNWISRIPIGLILGFWSGQQVQVWFNQYGPQIDSSLKPILPTTLTSLTVPQTSGLPATLIAKVNSQVYASQAISNIIFVFTVVAVLSYFLFSFDVKGKLLRTMSTSGRWLLMIGFGAIFGSTVMMRFSLLIDRMYFIWIEWLKIGIFHMR